MLLDMKRKSLFQALVLFVCCTTSCVDSKYDLADVDTDDLVVGDEWVAPLGTGSISADDIVNIHKVPSIQVESDGSYVAVYKGKLESKLKNGLRSEMLEVASAEVSTKDLSDLFNENFVLDLANPHIKLESGISKGAIEASLRLEAIRGNVSEATASNFVISAQHPDIWIGPVTPADPKNFFFVENKNIPSLLKIVPEKLELSLLVNADHLSDIPAGAFSEIQYMVEIPFAPAKGFEAVSVEKVTDAFDETFVDYIFSGGTATIFGEVTNEMPFDLSIEMVILDEHNQPVAITFPVQEVKGKTGNVKFEITAKDMPQMVTARHIDFKLHLSGRAESGTLKKGEKISLNLKLQKTGGISI